MKLTTSLLLLAATGCLNTVAQLVPMPDAGVDAGFDAGVDAGADAGYADAGQGTCDGGPNCNPLTAPNGCFCIGQTCNPADGALGGCVGPLDCVSSFTDAGALRQVCCDVSSGTPVCGPDTDDAGGWCISATGVAWPNDGGPCTPEQALNGCFCLGQACDPSLGALGGCVEPLQCYSSFNDAGAQTSTCCDFSSGYPQCGN